MQNSKSCKDTLAKKKFESYSEYAEAKREFEKEKDLENERQQLLVRPSWDETFMNVAKVVARRSKDPHTKVGCVIVKDGRILSIGYNGEPRNFHYNFDWSTSEKYDYVIHAELNAIANANYNNTSVKDGIVYLTLSPCKDCIKLLAQHGIKTIYYLEEYKDFEQTKFIAKNSDVKLIKLRY